MLSDLFFRVRTLFRHEAAEAELDEEMRFHIQQEFDKLVKSGLTRDEALRRARLGFGGLDQVKEECREARGTYLIETVFQDIRYGLRMLRQSPGFSAAAIITLALGIGANTAIFSVINSALIRPLPYAEPSSLVMLWEKNLKSQTPNNVVSPPDFLDWSDQTDVFSGMAAIRDERDSLTGSGDPQEVIVQYVSVNFFSVLGVTPTLGAGFSAKDSQDGHDNVVILDYGFWKERFAGDPAIIGETILVNGHPQTVVGIAPESFHWFTTHGSLTGEKPQMWSPFILSQQFRDRKNFGRYLTVVARLKPGVRLLQAQAQMNTIAAQIAHQYPDYNDHWGVNVVALRDQIAGDLRPALLILFGAVVFVLLIACANVSSLLLSRAVNRAREMAIRTATGASRWRIARQLMTESVLLSGIGGGIGMTLAIVSTNALLAVSPRNLLDLRAISIDWRVLAFAAGCTVSAGLLFGFLPSYISANSGIAETLKEGGRGSSAGKHHRRIRSAFLVAQIGLALVLLTGSGLLIRSFIRLVGVNPGFDSSHLLTFKVSLPSSRYSTDPARLVFFQRLLGRISQLPGVRSASMNSYPPLFSELGAKTAVHILSKPEQSLMDLPSAAVCVVGQDYFRTMGIPLRSGRTFNEQEVTQERHVVVINQAFADKYMSGLNPVGQDAVIFMKSLQESQNPPSEIIGVVGDVRQVGLDIPAEPAVYWPHPELVYSSMTIVIRTERHPLSLISAVRSQLKQMDAEVPMAGVATMDQTMSDSLSRSRFTMLILGVFAALALVLASVGIYGVIAYSVTQRTQEFGIRVALGADRRDVLWLVLREGTFLTLMGIGIGIVAALTLTRLMATLLYGVSATDPLTFTAVALLLTFIALGACYIPAHRAMRVNPMIALRHE